MLRSSVAAGRGLTRRVLVVAHDDPAASSAFQYSLEVAGYQVEMAGTGEEGLRRFDQFCPDLILLDIELPDVSGLDVCRKIRARVDTPQPAIIVVTSRTQEADRIAGFAAGADDFVAKPFSLSELLLRIRARLPGRPSGAPAVSTDASDDSEQGRVTLGPLEIDKASHRVFLMDKELNLSVQEMRLLNYLASDPGRMRTRRELLTAVWGYHPEATSRTVDTHVKRLRDKFGALATMIQTAHGVGYRLTVAIPGPPKPEEPGHKPRRR